MVAPALAFADHPIFNRTQFFILTPMMTQLRNVILQWLWCGATGGVVLGDSRVGKSRAIQWLSSQLCTRAQEPIPVHCMTVSGRDQNTIASVFRNLAYAIDRPPRLRDTADIMADALIHYLAESALVNRSRQVVLVVDEVQRLAISQLAAFAELHDKLLALNVNLVVIFVGNVGESDELLRRLDETAHNHIRARFFIHQTSFAGITHATEIKSCLQFYDNEPCPGPDGPTPTDYFLPQLYEQGWRLQTMTPLMWAVFHEHYQRPLKLASWGMQFFVATVNTLLVDYLPRCGIEDESALENMMLESIKVSGLARAQVTLR